MINNKINTFNTLGFQPNNQTVGNITSNPNNSTQESIILEFNVTDYNESKKPKALEALKNILKNYKNEKGWCSPIIIITRGQSTFELLQKYKDILNITPKLVSSDQELKDFLGVKEITSITPMELPPEYLETVKKLALLPKVPFSPKYYSGVSSPDGTYDKDKKPITVEVAQLTKQLTEKIPPYMLCRSTGEKKGFFNKTEDNVLNICFSEPPISVEINPDGTVKKADIENQYVEPESIMPQLKEYLADVLDQNNEIIEMLELNMRKKSL